MDLAHAFRGLRCLPKPSSDTLASLAGFVPAAHLSILGRWNGGEGWVGASHLRLFPAESLRQLNDEYGVDDFCRGARIFASDGCGESYVFDSRNGFSILQIPFIPLDWEFANPIAPDVDGFVEHLLSRPADGRTVYQINEEAFGKEVHDKHPIVLGGDPSDPANKLLVPADKHPEICTFWNKVVRQVRNETRTKS
jgi:hypothetical protein